MLAEDAGDDAGDVWRGEAVAGRCYPAAILPGDSDIDSPGPEFDRRTRVVVEALTVRLIMRRNGDDRGIHRWEARPRHVIGGRDKRHPSEVGEIGEFVQNAEKIRLCRAQAQVADVHPVLDCPAETGGEDHAAPDEPGAQDPDTVQLTVGSKGSDDASTGGPMAIEIAVRRRIEFDAIQSLGDRHVPTDIMANCGMVGINATVNHRDLHATTGTAAPGPFSRDPVERQDRLLLRNGARREHIGVRRPPMAHGREPRLEVESGRWRR